MKKRFLALLLSVLLLLSLGTAVSAAAAHTHTYRQTVTRAQFGKNGAIVKTCTVCGKQSKTAISAVKTPKLSALSFVYDGKTKTPTVTVKDKQGNTLKKGTDYKLTYAAGRKNSGRYTVKVTLRGNYTGSKTLAFKILPKQPGKPSASNVTASSVSLSWKQSKTATGYVVYRVEKSGSYTKLKTAKQPSVKLTNLQPETGYTFVVRAYTKTSKGNLYSSYSKPRTVKTASAVATQYKAVQKILATGVYTANLTFDEAPDASYKLSRRGNDYYMEMHMRDGGVNYDADLYYDGTAQCTYAKMFGVWIEMDDPEMRDMAPQMDVFSMMNLRDPASTAVGTEKVGGKTCIVETVTAQDGSATKLYFQNGTLVRVGLLSGNVQPVYCTISGFSGNVGNFEKPKHPLKLS